MADKISQTDLIDLIGRPLSNIIESAREVYGNLKQYEKECYGFVAPVVYDHSIGVIKFALLKLSVALEDKLRDLDIKDEFANFIIRYFTSDEKNMLRELERFSKLEPRVTSPLILADIIIAEHGKIYDLIKEAVSKGYVDLEKVLETWKSNLKIRDDIARVFIMRYRIRFENIIEAIKILLDQHPAWLKRLFREYEEALLASEDVRRRFEEESKRVFSREVEILEEKIGAMDGEKKRLQTMLESLDPKVKELEDLKRLLQEKERELEVLKSKLSQDSIAKIVLEHEINNLKRDLSEYETKMHEYEILKERMREMEMAAKGSIEGHLVWREIIDLYSELLISRAQRIIGGGKVSLYNPREDDEISIDSWDNVERYNSTLQTPSGLLNVSGVIFTKMRGVIFKRSYVVVEYLTSSHVEPVKVKGYDLIPLDVGDFLTILKTRIVRAETGEYYHLIVLSSPTGFTSTLINHIGGEKFWKNFASKYVTVYLLDPTTGYLAYNRGDPAANRNSKMANMELPEEQIEKVRKYLLSDGALMEAIKSSPVIKFLGIDRIIEATSIQDEAVLRRALGSLESEGIGRVKEVNGKIVFVYEKDK